MEIERVRIKNYKSIKDSGDLILSKLFAFIGRNNTGKSSILKAIYALLGEEEISENDFYNNTLENIELSATIKNFFQQAEKIEIKLIAKRKENDKPEIEYSINGEVKTKTTFNKTIPRPFMIKDIRDPEGEATGSKTSYLNKLIKDIESNLEIQTSEIESLKSKVESLKNKQIEKVSNIITEKFQDILSTIDLNVKIRPEVDLSKYSYSSDIINIKLNNRCVNVLSSGTGLQSIYILALLEAYAESAAQNESIFLIEEPEVYLHPELQRKMFAALRKIADINQVIFTTHSPIMISDLWIEESVKLVKLNDLGETIVNDLEIEDVINELGIRYEDVLNAKTIIFVEGEDDKIFFGKIINNNPKVKFVTTEGWRSCHYYAFVKIVTSQNVTADFNIVMDNDGLSQEERKKQLIDQIKKMKYGEHIINKIEPNIEVLDEYAMESYLLDKNLLKKAFSDILLEDLDLFINFYRNKYKEYKLKVDENSLKLEEFQKYFKPKNIFSNEELRRGYKNYIKIFNDKKFLEIREKVIQKCCDLKKSDKSYIGFILDSSGLDYEILKGPKELMNKIMLKNI